MKIIIEVDGQNVQPLTVDSITIYAGQRYSFILHANKYIDEKTSNYWIRSLPGQMADAGEAAFANRINSAILHYVGADIADPTIDIKTVSNPLQEWRLQPLVNPAAPGVPKPGKADKNLNLVITFNGTAWFVNNASFVPPPKPVLLQILSGAHTVQELYPAKSIIELPPNSVIELSIPGGGMPNNTRPRPVRFNVSLLWRGG
jgi:iron transport multicopper oxidase